MYQEENYRGEEQKPFEPFQAIDCATLAEACFPRQQRRFL